MNSKGDIVINLKKRYFPNKLEIPRNKFPFWFTLRSKAFMVVNNFCIGYFDVDRIIPIGNQIMIRFSHFHRIKKIEINDNIASWKYREFTYTPIKSRKRELRSK